jgi:hypothetical protein
MITGAIIGAIVGVLVVLLNFYTKDQRFKTIMKSITDSGVQYAALFHYANATRYKKSFKFYDSFGVLYLAGNTAYYKTRPDATPMEFDMKKCTIQQEENWRKLKWFSITTLVGEKHYFNSHKAGAFVNNSDETLKGLEIIKSKTNS